jgi:hypothetical protein
MPLEVAGEMCLVVKADGGGHVGGRSAIPDHIDSTAGRDMSG